MRRLLKICGALLVVMLSVLGVAIAMVTRSLRAEAEHKRAAFVARAEELLPQYLAQSATLDADPFFSAPRPEADAGAFLNPRLAWDGLAPRTTSKELALPPALRERVRGWGKQWVDHADEPALGALDFKWMQALSQYGHWNLRTGEPLEHLEHPDFLTLATPSYADLLAWTKLRLLRARKAGDYTAASAEVRQLAWLTYSNETLIGALFSVAMLRSERQAYDAAAAAHAKLAGWTAYDLQWLTLAKNTLTAGEAYASAELPDALAEQAKAARAPRCAGLTETALVMQLRKTYGRPVSPAFAQELAHPAKPCRLDMARWIDSVPAGERDSRMFQLLSNDPPSLWTGWVTSRLFPGTADLLLESMSLPEDSLSRFARNQE